jgi:MFS family permease
MTTSSEPRPSLTLPEAASRSMPSAAAARSSLPDAASSTSFDAGSGPTVPGATPRTVLPAEPVLPPDSAVTGAPMRGRFLLVFALANLGIWLGFFAPFIVTLQLKVQAVVPHDPTSALPIVLGLPALIGVIANPLAGRLSDRTTSRFGMRRPWLVGAYLLGIIGLTIDGLATTVPLLFVGTLLFGSSFAASLSVLLSLIPDHIPWNRRALASGLLGVTQGVATIVGAIVAGQLATRSMVAAFVVPGIVGFVLLMILVVRLEDRVLLKSERPPFRQREFWNSFWTNPLRFPNFGLAWISRFLLFLSFASVVNYQVFYLHKQLRLTVNGAAKLIPLGLGVETVALIVASVIAGALSDRLKRRKVFVIASALFGAAGLAVLGTATGRPLYFAGLLIIGLAQGTYFAVDLALVADVLPDRLRNAGKDMGLITVATQLPASVVTVIAPLLLAIPFGNVIAGSATNYTALFWGFAVFAVVAGLVIIPIRGTR